VEAKQKAEQQITDLRKAAESVQRFYEELNKLNDPRRDQLPMSFFRALSALTLEKAQQGVELHDIRFTAVELAKKVIELGYVKNKPKQTESDWVRTNWGKLEEVIESRKDHLQEVCRSVGYFFYPWIGKEESVGGQGNYSYYYLVSRNFNKEGESRVFPIFPQNGEIHYVQESLTNIPRWARWVNGLTLHSWKKYAYILPGMLSLLAILTYLVFILLLGLYTNISTVKWLTYLIVSMGMFWLILSSPLYLVSFKRIVMAPDWMTPFKETNVQLELRKIETNPETGNAIRELRLMVYSAKCPICENRVEVQSGGLQFPFRLVGRCNESPREHVFSFDHVTRMGKRLLQ